jgi:hypothetical protein
MFVTSQVRPKGHFGSNKASDTKMRSSKNLEILLYELVG